MSIKLRFLGHAGFQIITPAGTNALIDPWLAGNATWGVPPSPVRTKDLGKPDLVLVTHASFDHLGDTVPIVKKSGALLVCGTDTRLLAIQDGIPEEQIAVGAWGMEVQHKDILVKIVESHHQSSAMLKDGKYVTGMPFGFVVKTETGESVYHPGDTALFSDLKLIGEMQRPQIALLTIGGITYRGRAMAEMNPLEAAIAAKWLGAKIAIPMHFLPANAHEPLQFIEHLKTQSPQAKPVVLAPGEVFQFTAV